MEINYKDLSKEYNVLIAGTVGSGKSVLLNGLIYNLIESAPGTAAGEIEFFLIDPKRVELRKYAKLPHCAGYTDTIPGAIQILNKTIDIMESRYKEMQQRDIEKWDKGHLYILIDELSDIMITDAKRATDKLTKLLQLSRAAGIHVIACTQNPSRLVLPAKIQVNFTCVIGLHCRSAIESRQAIGMPGAELLPEYGNALYMNSHGVTRVEVPMIEKTVIMERVSAIIEAFPNGRKPPEKRVYNPLPEYLRAASANSGSRENSRVRELIRELDDERDKMTRIDAERLENEYNNGINNAFRENKVPMRPEDKDKGGLVFCCFVIFGIIIYLLQFL